jgi:hypothetical protein
MAIDSGSSAEVERAGEAEGETEVVQPAKRVIWTPERLAKAAATRAETKRKKEEREQKREAKRSGAPPLKHLTSQHDFQNCAVPDCPSCRAAFGMPSASAEQASSSPRPIEQVKPSAPNGFDWEGAPLEAATAKLADMRREYDRAATIVLKRQSASKPQWICWTQLHKDIVPVSVLRLCRKTGDEGRWAFRDDGVFKMVDGLRVPDPAFCCNTYCFEVYQKAKPMAALSRH